MLVNAARSPHILFRYSKWRSTIFSSKAACKKRAILGQTISLLVRCLKAMQMQLDFLKRDLLWFLWIFFIGLSGFFWFLCYNNQQEDPLVPLWIDLDIFYRICHVATGVFQFLVSSHKAPFLMVQVETYI